MPTLEVRRHTMRSKPGQHLSQDGISLAQHVGQDLDPFDFVVASELPRAIETAIAMGFAVDRLDVDLGILPKEVLTAIGWPSSLSKLSKVIEKDAVCRRFAQRQAAHWNALLDEQSDERSTLVITHGGIIELDALGLMPDADYSTWGDAIGYCEGFRFLKHNNKIRCQFLRLPKHHRLVHN